MLRCAGQWVRQQANTLRLTLYQHDTTGSKELHSTSDDKIDPNEEARYKITSGN